MRGSRLSLEFSSPVLETEHRMAIDAITSHSSSSRAASINVKDVYCWDKNK